jgi:WD40 repeat protein
LLITTGEGRVRIVSYPKFEPLYTINAHTSACFCLEMDPRGKYLAVGGSDALISLWDTQDWMCKHTLGHMEGPLRSVAFSWDGSYVVGGSDEGAGLEIVGFNSFGFPISIFIIRKGIVTAVRLANFIYDRRTLRRENMYT